MSCAGLKRGLSLILTVLLLTSVGGYSYAVEPKRIALTFDDGPHYRYTEEILDILKEHGVRATFFTVGSNVERYPELIQRELCEGHEVANHTYAHKHMAKLTDEEFRAEVKGWESVMAEEHGYTSDLFRPPEGILTDSESKIIGELGYDTVLWSIDTRDWAHNSVDAIVDTVISGVKDGSIILFHDFVSGDSPTPEALRRLIPRLKDMGYELVSVSELQK